MVQRPARRSAKPARSPWQSQWQKRFGRNEMRLEGKVAIVSGAASGMGAATARRFAKEGATVVIADMLEEDGKKIAADITRANGTAEFMRLDVTSEADWKAVVDATVQKYRKTRHPGEQRRHQRQRRHRHAGHRCVGPS